MLALFNEPQQLRSIDRVITLMDIYCKILQRRTPTISPFLYIGIISFRYLPIVKNAIAKLLPKNVLQIPQNQLSISQNLIQVGSQLILMYRIRSKLYLPIEGDDWTKGTLLRQYPQLPFRINVIHTLFDIHHLLLVQSLKILLAKALQCSLANQSPNRLPIVEDPIRLLMLLRNVIIQLY